MPCIPQKFRGKNNPIVEVNQQRWLEESGQWLENVYRTNLVLASGKPVLHKIKQLKEIDPNLAIVRFRTSATTSTPT